MDGEPFTFLVNCLRSGPLLLRWLHGVCDGGIFLAYMGIPITLRWIYLRMKSRPEARLFRRFGAFIVLCGLVHLTAIIAFFWPAYWLFAAVKALTAAVSLSVMVELYKLRHRIVALGAMAAELVIAIAREQAATAAAEQALEEKKATLAELEGVNARLLEQLGAIESRDRTIRELTSPILIVRPGVLLVPLVGTVDSARAGELQERLGMRCEAFQPHHVILDLTGVDAIDTQVAGALHGMTRLVSYLGGQCIITGMRAAVAQALVALDIRLAIPTHATLAEGIAAARRP